MKKIIICSVTVLTLLSCSKEENSVPAKGLNIESARLLDTITKGYTNSSAQELTWFLDAWNLEYTSNEDAINKEGAIANDILNIYKLLYKPFNINELGEHEWQNIYKDAKYIVIQNSVLYNFNYEDENFNGYDTIIDFRPDINFSGVKSLYFTPKYSGIINEFLSHGEGFEIMTEYDEETVNRALYLNRKLIIYPGHWGGEWHIITHPHISCISFNTAKTKARAYFRVVYMFGYADFEKKNEEWEMTYSVINGIE